MIIVYSYNIKHKSCNFNYNTTSSYIKLKSGTVEKCIV